MSIKTVNDTEKKQKHYTNALSLCAPCDVNINTCDKAQLD